MINSLLECDEIEKLRYGRPMKLPRGDLDKLLILFMVLDDTVH